MLDLLKSLNKKQREAVLYNEGPLVIIAGAGSGKTRTITYKIAYLIKEKHINPWKILAVTFTNKAANEMKKRIVDLIGQEGQKVKMYTYHSLCARILREEIEFLGMRKNFNIIDPIDQRQILKPKYKELGLSNKTLSYKTTIDYISRCKNLGMQPQDMQEDAKKDVDKALAKLYDYYSTFTKNSGNLDFDDLLIYTKNLFQHHEQIAQKWASKFEYLLVDEFQDTSLTQYEIVKKLSLYSNFSIVGDPDQTIYTWRFAESKLILNFGKNYKNSKIVLLEENYRSTQTILDAANKLIKKNKNRIDKNLFTSKPKGEEIEYFHGFSEDAEAKWVVSKIEQIKLKGGNIRDIAILYRSNYLTFSLEKFLISKNINYYIFGGVRFYQREEIKDIIAYLKIINNGDTVSLKRVINTPSRKIGTTSQERLFGFLETKGNNIFQKMQDHFNELPLQAVGHKKLAIFINLIRKYKKALSSNTLFDVAKKFLIEIEYSNKWSSYEDQGRAENIKEFLKSIIDWEKNNPNSNLTQFLNDISLFTEQEQSEQQKDSVALMTAHGSKGLEFKYVFIFGMSEVVFPSKRAIMDSPEESLEEERRLAYVAVTRAKEKLYISSSRGYGIDYKSQKSPSRFIKEMGLNPQNFTSSYIFPKSFEGNFVANDFIEGDKIDHDTFGKGIIVSVEGDIVKVAFKAPHGVKTMMKNHKSLRRVI